MKKTKDGNCCLLSQWTRQTFTPRSVSEMFGASPIWPTPMGEARPRWQAFTPKACRAPVISQHWTGSFPKSWVPRSSSRHGWPWLSKTHGDLGIPHRKPPSREPRSLQAHFWFPYGLSLLFMGFLVNPLVDLMMFTKVVIAWFFCSICVYEWWLVQSIRSFWWLCCAPILQNTAKNLWYASLFWTGCISILIRAES